jgi:putative proteasome-type protease
MTYAVALKMDRGLVFMSDTRTNAGVDNISTFRKMFTWTDEGDSVVTLLTAGNLATTQAVVSLIDERMKAPSDRAPSILGLPSMYQVARTVGNTLREVITTSSAVGHLGESAFHATIIVGGQVKGSPPRLFMIYPEGNFIEAGDDTPFFQIGETKYGRPILVRAYTPAMTFEAATKLLLVSFDSTIKANLSVGLPIDVAYYDADSFTAMRLNRIEQDDAYFQDLSVGWGNALRTAFDTLPDPQL